MATKYKQLELLVEGMSCPSCEILVEQKVKSHNAVKKVEVERLSGKISIEIEVSYDKNSLVKELNTLVEPHGYKISLHKGQKSISLKQTTMGMLIALVIIALYLFLQRYISVDGFSGNLAWSEIVMIGFIASLSSCMALVGSLVLGFSALSEQSGRTKSLIYFHVSRFLTFFLLGGVIGYIGSFFHLTGIVSDILELLIAFTLLFLGISMLEIFPGVERFIPHFDKNLGASLLQKALRSSFILPFSLGAITFILPCGFTQSMQLYALKTGSFIDGAVVMGLFVLGTFPVLALISIFSSRFTRVLKTGIFYKMMAFLIIFFAVINIVGIIR